MSINNPLDRGVLLSKIIAADRAIGMFPMEYIIESDDAEIYFFREMGDHKEPEFYMVTDDGLFVKISPIGVMKSVHKLADRNGRISLEAVAESDAYNTYTLHRKAFPVDNISYDPKKPPEQVLESLVRHVYAKVDSARHNAITEFGKNFSILTYEALVARFNLMQTSLSPTDIIPDGYQIYTEAGVGCPDHCAYCREWMTPHRVYTIQQYIKRLENTKSALIDVIGEGKAREITEGFINISDITLPQIMREQGRTNLSSFGTAVFMKQHFHWLNKVGSFIGAKRALMVSEDSYGAYALNGSHYSPHFFEELHRCGVNRLYLGLETALTEGSFLLNKKITYEEKLAAARLIQAAGIRLKVIVQLGVLGQSFYTPEGVFIPWHTAVDETIKWINEAEPYRVMLSVWQNYENLPINALIKNRRIVPYDNQDEGVESERHRLMRGIGTLYNQDPIEHTYEAYLQNHARRGRVAVWVN